MKTRLCLVRHGETAWNAEQRLQGHTDVPLNEVGLAQAEATAAKLAAHRFDALYSSDLKRARQTAEASARRLGLQPVYLQALRERHFGKFQGLTYEQARQRYPAAYEQFEAREPRQDFETGESLEAFAERIRTAITELAARHAGQQILIVAHGGVLDTVNRMVRGLPLQPARDFVIPNAALNWISHEAGRWQIEAWAQQTHLAAARDELPHT